MVCCIYVNTKLCQQCPAKEYLSHGTTVPLFFLREGFKNRRLFYFKHCSLSMTSIMKPQTLVILTERMNGRCLVVPGKTTASY